MTIHQPQSQVNIIDLTKRLSILRASPALPELDVTNEPCPRCTSHLMKLEGDRTGSRFCTFCGWNNGGA